MGRFSPRSLLLGLAAPLGALAFAVLVCAVILGVTGHSPLDTVDAMVSAAQRPRTFVNSLNSATTYYLAAVAVAIGFKMKLFNIGVDGQYRLAAMLSAALAGATFMEGLPSFLRVALTVVAAMLVGAGWAGVAALLKVTRGVSEVISTIMLNAIATYLVSYLLNPARLAEDRPGSNNVGTRPIDGGGQVAGLEIPGSSSQLFGLVFLAALVGFGYWFVLARTRFGFELKATGLSESAAVASGVSVKKMVLVSMLLSGAVAGLVGMPQLLGSSYSYSLDFPPGIGFIGIAVALLGRNHPVGMALAALLWGFLDNSSNSLDVAGVPREIVGIMQGVIVLSVVVAYELVRRYRVRAEQRDVGTALGRTKTAEEASA
ncbi:Nucleoside ABC transporter, permease protein 1 [Actinokineospora spheciospongiae]|uniref:Nucleoside ABC transporter, permease protein 1 n=1 Tax=Actinokineospora spheciospongiae TaxID=909613 RepID=W7IIY1_9PSEU|nr:ABC transporter permease [Actinokineospora spheciospongiae]EWC60705.1 Nucleoside ABC transporter, permease protein 1 [Actinokineospora spheciospongiae]